MQVQEGAKLAKRVDRLRELVADEEAALASFRSKMVAAISTEIQELTKDKDALLTDLKLLQATLAEGTKKLDEREQALHNRVETIEKKEKDLNVRLFQLSELQGQLETNEKALAQALRDLEYKKMVITDLATEAAAARDEAQTVLAHSQRQAQAVTDHTERVQKELSVRDIEIASRERDITIKEERVSAKEKTLVERELRLIDREATLEREFKRLKKQHEPHRTHP